MVQSATLKTNGSRAMTEVHKTLQPLDEATDQVDHRRMGDTVESDIWAESPPIATVIKAERTRRGWTQQELAEAVGVSQPEIARWESGRVRDISLKMRNRLADIGIDRFALGVSGVGLVKAGADVTAAINQTVLLSDPHLALSLLHPTLRWLEHLWSLHVADKRDISQEEVYTLAQGRYAYGLICTLTATGDSSIALSALLRSLQAFSLLEDEELRVGGISASRLLLGNELRKSGKNLQAAYNLHIAAEAARRASLWRRQAEALGLSAYAHAAMQDRVRFRRAVEETQSALEKWEGRDPLGICPEDSEASVFCRVSLMEITVRGAIILGDEKRAENLILSSPLNGPVPTQWDTYYSITALETLIATGHADWIEWAERSYFRATRPVQPQQLIRLGEVVKFAPQGRESASIRERISVELGRVCANQ